MPEGGLVMFAASWRWLSSLPRMTSAFAARSAARKSRPTESIAQWSCEAKTEPGQLVLNGFYPAPDESRLDWHWLRTKELIAYFPNSRNRTRLQATLDLIAEGSLDTRSLVTHEFALAQAPEAYALLLEPQANFLGIVLDWRGA